MTNKEQQLQYFTSLRTLQTVQEQASTPSIRELQERAFAEIIEARKNMLKRREALQKENSLQGGTTIYDAELEFYRAQIFDLIDAQIERTTKSEE